MNKSLVLAIFLSSIATSVEAEDFNLATTELIGDKDPNISEDFVRNIFTKKELSTNSLFIKSDSQPINVVVIYSKISLFSFSLVNGNRVARCQTPCEVRIPQGAPFIVRAWKDNLRPKLTTPLPEWKLRIPGAPGLGKKLKNTTMIFSLSADPTAPKSEDEIMDKN